MTRRPAVLPALLLVLLLGPSAATADAAPGRHPGTWGGGTPTVTVQTEDPADAADASDDPTVGPDEAAPDDSAADDGTDAADDGTRDDGSDDGVDDDGSAQNALGGTLGPDPAVLVPVPSSRRTVKGRVARLRTDGRAAIPRSAPKRVKRVLAAANLIIGKPYKWGGGHGRLFDSGYDCSGAVGYALIRAGLLSSSMVSGTFARWAVGGAGRWISIHANAGHVYMEVAGLRLDTSAVGDPTGAKGVRWRPVIGRRVGFHTRHIKGL